jgi:hypothetical protein
MKQVKEEADRNKQSEARRNKEVAQLKRDQIQKENRIRNLDHPQLPFDSCVLIGNYGMSKLVIGNISIKISSNKTETFVNQFVFHFNVRRY